MIVEDLWLTDLDFPYPSHARFDMKDLFVDLGSVGWLTRSVYASEKCCLRGTVMQVSRV